LGDVYTCHGFLPRISKFEKADSKTFLYKLIKGFVDERFITLGNLLSTKFMEPNR
jgi:hypothetical protein